MSKGQAQIPGNRSLTGPSAAGKPPVAFKQATVVYSSGKAPSCGVTTHLPNELALKMDGA